MPIPVDAKTNLKIKPGKALKDGGKFGTSRLVSARIVDLEMNCGKLAGSETDCLCVVESLEVEVVCEIRLNPEKIRTGYFDIDKLKGDKGKKDGDQLCPPSEGHLKLDEQNVLVHECSHCEDIASVIREEVKKQLDRAQNGTKKQQETGAAVTPQLLATCPCDDQATCKKALCGLVRERFKAIANKRVLEFVKRASQHKKKSQTERTARVKQRDDLVARKEPGEKVPAKKPKRGKGDPKYREQLRELLAELLAGDAGKSLFEKPKKGDPPTGCDQALGG